MAVLSKYKVLVTTLVTAGKLYSAAPGSLMVKVETITCYVVSDLNILGLITIAWDSFRVGKPDPQDSDHDSNAAKQGLQAEFNSHECV